MRSPQKRGSGNDDELSKCCSTSEGNGAPRYWQEVAEDLSSHTQDLSLADAEELASPSTKPSRRSSSASVSYAYTPAEFDNHGRQRGIEKGKAPPARIDSELEQPFRANWFSDDEGFSSSLQPQTHQSRKLPTSPGKLRGLATKPTGYSSDIRTHKSRQNARNHESQPTRRSTVSCAPISADGDNVPNLNRNIKQVQPKVL
ncbi:hypothetical protein EK21DRAFT_119309 [Setomelanomma holmii]|uniref:Uncharacterized protein n=1 Tax=Setomelanomma holmii TaxID=210430 RepID=A0A9P4GVR5_9PLEO|nr:hypothetical protein EK21DRAFT_119309 [Setomelanomma holmii]